LRILLVVYDNDSYIHWFPRGLAYIVAVLKKAGHYVEIYNQDVHHYPGSHLREFLDHNPFDVVGLGFIGGYYQYRKALKISAAINGSGKRPFYIIAGRGPTPKPEFFMRKTGADAVVMGEGEITILELLNALKNGQALDQVKGIALRENELFKINERQPLIEDVDDIPFPAYEIFPISYYRLFRVPHCTNSDFLMPMLSGRG
jgi:anaerobic magnesium-protoporphyrin IX monomethyl ester cyclase